MRPLFTLTLAAALTLPLAACSTVAPADPITLPAATDGSSLEAACARLLVIADSSDLVDMSDYVEITGLAQDTYEAAEGPVELMALRVAAQMVVQTAVPIASTTPSTKLNLFADSMDEFSNEISKLEVICA